MKEVIEALQKQMQEEIDEYTEGYNDGLIIAMRIIEDFVYSSTQTDTEMIK